MEPGKLVSFFNIRAFPDETLMALTAPKSLFVIGCKSITFNIVSLANGAGLF
jgi:hypothetical protein